MAFDLGAVVAPYTMATPERVDLVIDLARKANELGLPGDFVECGCCNGGLSAVLAQYGILRKTWLFDSFAGLPPSGPNDGPSANGNRAENEIGACVGQIERVEEVMKKLEYPGPVQIVKGWFADTFPRVEIPKIAVLLLDSDWYASELLCWQKFYDSVVPGGFIYIDDFAYWPGCRKAMDDFFNSIGASLWEPRIYPVGHSAWIQKGER